MNRVPAVLCCLATLLTGCAKNAIFELTFETPVAVEPRTYVLIEARSGEASEVSFEDDWQQTQIRGIELDTAAPMVEENTFLVSFETTGEDIAKPLNVRVRFCVEVRCQELNPDAAVDDANPPELRYRFDRAFYQGRYTTFSIDVADFPPSGENDEPITTINKCMIVGEGCREGGSTNNCLADDRHFCEAT
jgi:hypothetical protein